MSTESLLISTVLLVMLATYVICGVPFGLLLGRYKGTDPRTVGSKNIGATNVFRSISYWAGGITALLDILKGFLCTFFGVRIVAVVVGVGVEYFLPARDEMPHFAWVSAFIFLAAVFGHVFSPYLKFRGGKGIAVGFGAALGFSPLIALGLVFVWALCTFPSRYVSVGSIASAVALPFLALFIYYPVTVSFELPFILVAITVVWAHRKNLQRLKDRTELPFSFKHGNHSGSAVSAKGATDATDVNESPKAENLKTATDHKADSNESEKFRTDPHFPEKGTGLFFGSEPGLKEHIQSRMSETAAKKSSHDAEKIKQISDAYRANSQAQKGKECTKSPQTDRKETHE